MNNKWFRLLIFVFVFVIVLTPVFAKEGKMILLAVQNEVNQTGVTAEVHAQIVPGKGRVFIETYPFTNTDLQISTRFAKEIACKYADKDCDKLDFMYTIKTGTSNIAGPSAGAALAVLTSSILLNLDLDEKVVITGTINSGGTIGVVGGVKAKIDVSKKIGMKKVLVPYGSKLEEINVLDLLKNKTHKNNKSVTEYGKEIGIEVIEVIDMDSAIEHLTGIKKESVKEIVVDKNYNLIMGQIAEKMCSRSLEIKEELSSLDVHDFFTGLENTTKRSQDALNDQKYYSAASYCFTNNLKMRIKLFEEKNYTNSQKEDILKNVERAMTNIEERFDKFELKTMGDLQTYMIVKERIIESKEYLEDFRIDNSSNNLAYALERLQSATVWAWFLGQPGEYFKLDEYELYNSCNSNIIDAESRSSYVKEFVLDTSVIDDSIKTAKEHREKKEYAMCLFEATKAKATADTILSGVGLEVNELPKLIDIKLELAKKIINKEMEKKRFPILGYSYYQYAESLKENNKASALLYAHYALELSNLDLYFEKKKFRFDFNFNFSKEYLFGIIVGILMTLIVLKGFRRDRLKHN